MRLELLLGHIQLYGLGNASAAAEHYTTVRQANPEPILLDIAQQGLEHCQVLLSGTAEAEPVLDGIEQGDVVPEGSVLGNSDPDQEPGAAEGPANQRQLWTARSATGLEDGSTPETIETAGATGAAFPFTPTAVASGWNRHACGGHALDGGSGCQRSRSPGRGRWRRGDGLESLSAGFTGDAGLRGPAAWPWRRRRQVSPHGARRLNLDRRRWLQLIAVAPIAVEVVDEPELIEVHQADPARAEEIEVVPIEAEVARQPSPWRRPRRKKFTVPPPLFTPEEEEELARGLLRVVLR